MNHNTVVLRDDKEGEKEKGRENNGRKEEPINMYATRMRARVECPTCSVFLKIWSNCYCFVSCIQLLVKIIYFNI